MIKIINKLYIIAITLITVSFAFTFIELNKTVIKILSSYAFVIYVINHLNNVLKNNREGNNPLTQYTMLTSPFLAIVVKIIDGDTITVINLQNLKTLTIRLASIDAPESTLIIQSYGLKAKQLSQKLINYKVVIIIPLGINKQQTDNIYIADNHRNQLQKLVYRKQNVNLYFDKYNRLIAYIITPKGNCLNAQLLKQGMAIYKSYHLRTQCSRYLLNLETKAIRQKIGMWKGL